LILKKEWSLETKLKLDAEQFLRLSENEELI
jgi:hypothetical protein